MSIQYVTRRFVCLAGGLALAGSLQAAPISCNVDPTINYMQIDDSEASACLASGTGNLTGNPGNDLFLNSLAGEDYGIVGKSDEPNLFNISYTSIGDGTGGWSFDSSFWDLYSSAALGFKFGTGNTPDEWFVFSLQDGVSAGSWAFFHGSGFDKQTGGGLSHINLYFKDAVAVPEPGTLALLGLGITGLVAVRRKKAAN